MSELKLLREELERYAAHAARLRLLGEDKTYPIEFNRCLERIAVRQRLIARRQHGQAQDPAPAV